MYGSSATFCSNYSEMLKYAVMLENNISFNWMRRERSREKKS